MEVAEGLDHPFDSDKACDPDLAKAIFDMLTQAADLTKLRRAECLAHYWRRARDLHPEEAKLRAEWTAEERRVMGSKRVLVFLEMCRDADIPTEFLEPALRRGVPIVGRFPFTGLLKPELKVQGVPEDALRSFSRWAQGAISGRGRPSQDLTLDEEVHAATQDEVAKGWMSGPFTAAEVSAKVGPDWALARRFGIRQNKKLRCIDDYSEFMVNSACGVSEAIEIGGVDEIVVTARMFVKSFLSGRCRFELPSGEVLDAPLHASWSGRRAKTMMGRLLDLKNAYKQLMCHWENRWAAVVAVWSPGKQEYELYLQTSLAFGQIGAVYGFNAFAKALRLLAVRLLGLSVTN